MAYTLDLGAAPLRERHAELGRTPGFSDLNAFEVHIYRIALLAVYGPPPTGCQLIIKTRTRATGRSRTLTLHVIDEIHPAPRAYAAAIAGGIATWADAELPSPVDYDHVVPIIPIRNDTELVLHALLATRPRNDATDRQGTARLHANLTAAFPDVARIARESGA